MRFVDPKERFLAVLLVLTACSGAPKQSGVWEDIDYSSVYRKAGERENDRAYTPPSSVINCVDDDLYNCNPR